MFDIELTRHLAELSKIAFTDEELERINAEMGDIIGLMDKVKDFDKNEKTYALDAVAYKELRADEPKESEAADRILSNAKRVQSGSFTVPKVV